MYIVQNLNEIYILKSGCKQKNITICCLAAEYPEQQEHNRITIVPSRQVMTLRLPVPIFNGRLEEWPLFIGR